MDERDIIKTTSKSRISILDEKQMEVEDIRSDGKNDDLISYTVSKDTLKDL